VAVVVYNVLCEAYSFDPLGFDVGSLAADRYSILFALLTENESETKVLKTTATHTHPYSAR